jgi:hypothetical protein
MAQQTYRLIGKKQLQRALDKLGGRTTLRKLKIVITKNVILLTTRLREAMTGGTSANKLAVRSGKLRRNTKARKTTVEGTHVRGTVGVGSVYARVHVSWSDQVTTITPKRARFLTIPLPAALTPAGVPRGTARNGPWGKTVIIPTKRQGKAQAIIYGVKKTQSGANVGAFRGGLIPLFVLARRVTVKSRIHIKDFMPKVQRSVRRDLRKEIRNAGREVRRG